MVVHPVQSYLPPLWHVPLLVFNHLRRIACVVTVLPFTISDVNMSNRAAVLIAVAVILSGFAAWRLLSAWLKYRGRMVITCPENQKPAGISVDAGHAAATAFSGATEFRLSDCSRWLERADCGRQCLQQVAESPENCLARNILIRWYAGKSCAWCDRPIGEIRLGERQPALLMPDRVSLTWAEIPAEKLTEVLGTALPICFSCHTVNALVRTHPELVIDRSRPMFSGTSHRPHTS